MNAIYSDGSPVDPVNLPPLRQPPLPGARTEGTSLPARITRRVERIQQAEGPRGRATRASVYFRYMSYMFFIVAACAVTQAATEGVPYASNGGWIMLLSIAAIVLVGAGATMFYANLRPELIEKVRQYIFGYILPSGVLVAIFLRVSQDWFGPDTFGTTLSQALPVVFLATVVLPTLVFVKEVTGLRTIYRSRMDDQEAVALWTRQDGFQR